MKFNTHIKKANNKYFINLPLSMPRVDKEDYKRVWAEESKWEPVANAGTHGMLCASPLFDLSAGRFEFREDLYTPSDEGQPVKDTYMFEVISSALLLYRILCMFKCTVQSYGSEGYKRVWAVTLKHRKTGELLQLSEHKGGVDIWTQFSSAPSLPTDFRRDILSLLNTLCDPKMPHPYDGTVAGTVA